MRPRLLALTGTTTFMTSVVVAMFVSTADAEVISDTQIVLTGNPAHTQYGVTVFKTTPGDYTGVLFDYTGTSLTASPPFLLDEGSDWYIVNTGDVFSPQTIAANQFPVLFSNSLANSPPFPTLNIPLGNFYLGVATSSLLAPPGQFRDVFGWLQLNNTGSQLLPLANAVAYNEPGIIIGTTTPAPEPATLALLAPLSLLLPRRSKTTPPRRRELS